MIKILFALLVSAHAKDLNLNPVSKVRESVPEKSVPQLEIPPLVCETKEGVFALGPDDEEKCKRRGGKVTAGRAGMQGKLRNLNDLASPDDRRAQPMQHHYDPKVQGSPHFKPYGE